MNRIVRSLGKLSKCWLKKSFSFRKKAVKRLEEKSGFSRAQAEALLNALFSELTPQKLSKLLKAELRDPRVLDGFRRDPVTKNFHRAVGPKQIAHIFPGNVPNPAIVSFVLGMLVKARNVGKLSSRDPGILELYLDSLRAHDPRLAGTNRIIWSNARPWIESSDLVVAYGSDETLAGIKKTVPAGAQFIGYGHRVSFSIYTRESLKKKAVTLLAAKTAKDIWMMDQRGCLSPTVIYVERGGEVSPFSFAAQVKKYLKDGQWTMLVHEKMGRFSLSVSPRTIFIRGFKKIEQVYKEILPMKQYLQAVALETSSGRRNTIAERLADLGVSRICPAGRLQFPPVTWHHDGRPNIASWLRWIDLEHKFDG